MEDDLSVKTQLLLMVSYGLRHLPIFKHPKRYLEAVAKFQHKLPSPFQLDLSHAAGLYKETVAYEFLSRTLVRAPRACESAAASRCRPQGVLRRFSPAAAASRSRWPGGGTAGLARLRTTPTRCPST